MTTETTRAIVTAAAAQAGWVIQPTYPCTGSDGITREFRTSGTVFARGGSRVQVFFASDGSYQSGWDMTGARVSGSYNQISGAVRIKGGRAAILKALRSTDSKDAR